MSIIHAPRKSEVDGIIPEMGNATAAYIKREDDPFFIDQ